MIVRRDTLSQALDDIEAGTLAGASTIIVGRSWWDRVSTREQDLYRARAERAGTKLRADDLMAGHFVEIRGGEVDPSLSTEHPT